MAPENWSDDKIENHITVFINRMRNSTQANAVN